MNTETATETLETPAPLPPAWRVLADQARDATRELFAGRDEPVTPLAAAPDRASYEAFLRAELVIAGRPDLFDALVASAVVARGEIFVLVTVPRDDKAAIDPGSLADWARAGGGEYINGVPVTLERLAVSVGGVCAAIACQTEVARRVSAWREQAEEQARAAAKRRAAVVAAQEERFHVTPTPMLDRLPLEVRAALAAARAVAAGSSERRVLLALASAHAALAGTLPLEVRRAFDREVRALEKSEGV